MRLSRRQARAHQTLVQQLAPHTSSARQCASLRPPTTVVQMLARAVLFRPSYVLLANPAVDLGGALDASAVHALVAPLVRRLNRPPHLHASGRDAAKATAALERVASGLAANPSVDPRELLLYVYSTCAPFLKSRFGGHRRAVRAPGDDEAAGSSGSDGSDSDDEGDEEKDEEKLEEAAKRTTESPASTPEAPPGWVQPARQGIRQLRRRRSPKARGSGTSKRGARSGSWRARPGCRPQRRATGSATGAAACAPSLATRLPSR